MPFLLQPFHVMLVVLSEYVRREQEKQIEYLREESQILREKIGGNRILLTDDQRRRVAARGKFLGDISLRRWRSSLKLTPFFAGIENSSRILNSVPVRLAVQGDHASIKKLSTWFFAWPGRTRHGATREFRAS